MSRPPDITDVTASGADPDADPTVLDLADESAGDLLSALASPTARTILQRLHESPTHPATLTDATGTSLQNVLYHLSRLEAAGAVEVVERVYSEKGREMSVYAPTAEPLVLVSGEGEDVEETVALLSRLLGAVGLLALAGVASQWLVEWLFYPGGPTQVVRDGVQYAVPPTTNVAPPVGVLVFLVGLFVLSGWLVWRRR